jgi:DNA ligase 1
MSLDGRVIALTGTLPFPRKHYEQLIAEHGGTFAYRITRKVNLLVAADPQKKSVKLDAARKRGTEIVDCGFFDRLTPLIDAVNEEEEEEEGGAETAAGIAADRATKGPEPYIRLKEGQSIKVVGTSKNYDVRLRGGVYYCTCPAWRNQSKGPVRTCKHLRRLLGDAFEAWRVGHAPGAPVPGAKPLKRKVSAGKPALMLAKKWKEDSHDPTGWFVSEKYDGLRAFWDGAQFVSRAGNRFFAPPFFVRDLPTKTTLDGELYLGRKQFNETSSIVRTQDGDDERWRSLKFMLFDVPSLGARPFEERLEYMRANFADHEFVQVVPQTKAKGRADVLARRDALTAADAEGLMLRRPGSLYVGARTDDLQKVKVWHDAEATVTGHAPGKGRHKGRLGALECTALDNGAEFRVGTGFSDEQRDDPPAVGATITFKYQELTNAGIPRFPVFLKMAEPR